MTTSDRHAGWFHLNVGLTLVVVLLCRCATSPTWLASLSQCEFANQPRGSPWRRPHLETWGQKLERPLELWRGSGEETVGFPTQTAHQPHNQAEGEQPLSLFLAPAPDSRCFPSRTTVMSTKYCSLHRMPSRKTEVDDQPALHNCPFSLASCPHHRSTWRNLPFPRRIQQLRGG